jgi:hypothetical protein
MSKIYLKWDHFDGADQSLCVSAVSQGADGSNAALHFRKPLTEQPLRFVGFCALGCEELCLVVCVIEATLFFAHVVRETLARPISAVAVLLKLDHPQLAPMYVFVYLGRFRN